MGEDLALGDDDKSAFFFFIFAKGFCCCSLSLLLKIFSLLWYISREEKEKVGGREQFGERLERSLTEGGELMDADMIFR